MVEQGTPLLKQVAEDHEYATELSQKISTVVETKERMKYKNSLVRNLSRYLVGMEMVVYPVLNELMDNSPLIPAGKNATEVFEVLKAAHIKIKEELYDVDQMVAIQADFPAKLDKLMELVDSVFNRESDLISQFSDAAFKNKQGTNPLLDQKFTSDYLAAKESATTRPHSYQPLSNPLILAAACACETPFDKMKDSQREFAD